MVKRSEPFSAVYFAFFARKVLKVTSETMSMSQVDN